MTICADARLLADTARALAARRALEPVLERLADAWLNPCSWDELTSSLDGSHPPAAAALDRLRASDAAAPHPPVQSKRRWRTGQHQPPELQAPARKWRHR